jgi:transposase-like protein
MTTQIKKYLKPAEVAERYNLSVNTLRKWRCEKRGLPFHVLGRAPGMRRSGTIVYDSALVEEFFNKGLVNVR